MIDYLVQCNQVRLWTQNIRVDYNKEEFDEVNKECIEYHPITPGIERLMKDDLKSPEARDEDYARKIDDPPNIGRPPVSEDLLTLLFSNDFPLVDETLRFLNDMLQEEIKGRNQVPSEPKKVWYCQTCPR